MDKKEKKEFEKFKKKAKDLADKMGKVFISYKPEKGENPGGLFISAAGHLFIATVNACSLSQFERNELAKRIASAIKGYEND